MGRRDEPELMPSDGELAAAEAHTRRLLARFGEPSAVAPPAGLADRIVAAMPSVSRPIRPLRRRALGWAITAAASVLVVLGVWVTLGIGLAPASVAEATLLGQLTISLAARPLGTLPSGAGLVIVLGALVGGAWLWWRYVHRRDGA